MAIHIKKKNIGKFTAYKKRTGKSTSEALHSKSSSVRKMANFARNAKKWKHEDGGLVQYGWGGSIAAAGQVASMIPTPWTQIGGAALSMVGGIVGGNEEKKLAEEAQRKQAQSSADIGQAGISNPYQPTFAMGGVIPNGMPNVEVEGGEMLQGKDGSMAEVNGPKHSKGGIQLMMENGGRVFSDKIINPETGNTFAKDAEKFMKMMK